jgi:PIN domain nuclease of toxin-antitoxin system
MGRSLLILVDTHVVMWLAFEETRISKRAASAIAEARRDDGLAISGVTLIEVAMLYKKGRISMAMSLESLMGDVEGRFAVLPITGSICVRAMAMPREYPNDPMDRIIGATALVEGLKLVTADRAIRDSQAVSTVW